MSTLTLITESIAALLPNSGSSEDSGSMGADAVRTAITEVEDLTNREFDAELGEPEIHEGEGRYFKEPKVVVPVKDSPFDGVSRLVFDLPKGWDDDLSEFNELLSFFDLQLDTMEEIEGEKVPMRFVGGNAAVVWDEVETESDTDKGAASDSSESEKAVNVEEETISGGDTDA